MTEPPGFLNQVSERFSTVGEQASQVQIIDVQSSEFNPRSGQLAIQVPANTSHLGCHVAALGGPSSRFPRSRLHLQAFNPSLQQYGARGHGPEPSCLFVQLLR